MGQVHQGARLGQESQVHQEGRVRAKGQEGQEPWGRQTGTGCQELQKPRLGEESLPMVEHWQAQGRWKAQKH